MHFLSLSLLPLMTVTGVLAAPTIRPHHLRRGRPNGSHSRWWSDTHSQSTPVASAAATSADSLSASASSSADTCAQYYTVLPRQNGYEVSDVNHLSLDQLRALNPSLNADMYIEAGQQLCVKDGSNSTVASSTSSASASATPSGAANGTVSSDGWKLAHAHEGQSFFDDWLFFGDLAPSDGSSSNDPTHGQVIFVGKDDAWNQKLVSADASGAVMKIDGTSGKWMRNSIRIQTKYALNVGSLVILDATHIPAADAGLWPAFWSTGPDWPTYGEIDLLEYVNAGQHSQSSIHTNNQCNMGSTGFNASSYIVGGTYCSAADTGNGGCGVITPDALAGAAFNAVGGGIYAYSWTDKGIATYFFARSDIPADITARAPTPSSWGLPTAFFAADACNPATVFQNHNLIFDLTTCGDWAGNAFDGGLSACQSHMQNADLSEAYFNVNSVLVYNDY